MSGNGQGGGLDVPRPHGRRGVGRASDAASQTNAAIEAQTLASEFDLAGAATLLASAGQRGDLFAQLAGVYLRGLIDAHEASRQGGSPDSLMPVRQAIAWLEIVANGRPGSAEIARLMLQAAAAAAQSEREEMRLYLDTAIRMETLQRAAGLPGAPIIAAAETAGDLWLQVHRYDEARRAYDDAGERFGSSLRILAGRARAARGLNDPTAACAALSRASRRLGPAPGDARRNRGGAGIRRGLVRVAGKVAGCRHASSTATRTKSWRRLPATGCVRHLTRLRRRCMNSSTIFTDMNCGGCATDSSGVRLRSRITMTWSSRFDGGIPRWH